MILEIFQITGISMPSVELADTDLNIQEICIYFWVLPPYHQFMDACSGTGMQYALINLSLHQKMIE